MAIRWQDDVVVATCKYGTVALDPVYYSAVCSANLETEKLHLKNNNFNLIVYPNVTGSQADFQFGVSLSAVVDIGKMTPKHCSSN